MTRTLFLVLTAFAACAAPDSAELEEAEGGGPELFHLRVCEGLTWAAGRPSCRGSIVDPIQQAPLEAGRGATALVEVHGAGQPHQIALFIERGGEVVETFLSAPLGDSEETWLYQELPVLRDGAYRLRAAVVAVDSCRTDAAGLVLGCTELAPEGLFVPTPRDLTVTEARRDPVTGDPRHYDFTGAAICAARPTSQLACAGRAAPIRAGETFFVQLRLARVTAPSVELRIGVYRAPLDLAQPEVTEPILAGVPELLPDTGQYGNQVSGWSVAWGAVYAYLPAGHYVLVPKVYDLGTGLTHFETGSAIAVDVQP